MKQQHTLEEDIDSVKKSLLKRKSRSIGDPGVWLSLTSAERAYDEIRFLLAEHLIKIRKNKRLTQLQAAYLIKSSQSRVAKMEGNKPSVSLDLLIHALLSLGVSRKDIGILIGT